MKLASIYFFVGSILLLSVIDYAYLTEVNFNFAGLLATREPVKNIDHKEKYMYVCLGDETKTSPDMLAVVDADVDSLSYGRILTSVPFGGASAIGNEPHHAGITGDGKYVGCGGLLSVLKGQDEIFWFDVTNPTQPKYMRSDNPPLSSVTDDFYPLSNGGFLITMMGSATGMAPGRIAEYDENLDFIAEWPVNPPEDFNPHGISVREDLNLMFTSDFLSPGTTLESDPDPIAVRSTIRIWNFQKREIIKTIEIPGAAGLMDVQMIPRIPEGYGYCIHAAHYVLYLIEASTGTAIPVFNISDIIPLSVPTLFLHRTSKDGTRYYVACTGMGALLMFDITDKRHPVLLDSMLLGLNSGLHYLKLNEENDVIYVSGYFLEEGAAGKVHFDGDHMVHAVKLTRNSMELDRRFEVDFHSLHARPHGLVLK